MAGPLHVALVSGECPRLIFPTSVTAVGGLPQASPEHATHHSVEVCGTREEEEGGGGGERERESVCVFVRERCTTRTPTSRSNAVLRACEDHQGL